MDHVHFQYNAFLIGILILSVSCVRKEQNLSAAALYTSLVMFKHLFVVMAPLFFVYMLRNYCFEAAEKKPKQFTPRTQVAKSYLQDWISTKRTFSLIRLIKMGCTVLSVAAIAMCPILFARGTDLTSVSNEMKQILSRLFPWNRGLVCLCLYFFVCDVPRTLLRYHTQVHSYWAPNIWALYAASEKVLSKIFGISSTGNALTGGIVGSCDFSVLPNVRHHIARSHTKSLKSKIRYPLGLRTCSCLCL